MAEGCALSYAHIQSEGQEFIAKHLCKSGDIKALSSRSLLTNYSVENHAAQVKSSYPFSQKTTSIAARWETYSPPVTRFSDAGVCGVLVCRILPLQVAGCVTWKKMYHAMKLKKKATNVRHAAYTGVPVPVLARWSPPAFSSNRTPLCTFFPSQLLLRCSSMSANFNLTTASLRGVSSRRKRACNECMRRRTRVSDERGMG